MIRVLFFLFAFMGLYSAATLADQPAYIPILVYHNIDPIKKGSMTISTRRLTEQLQWLKQNGFTFIPLKEAVQYLRGKITSLPAKPVVITADDGRAAIYHYLLPLARQYHIPVTLFIYPQVISQASWALTWEQLKTLQQTGLFDIQDHTYWHPNFKEEKHHLSEAAYAKLVDTQLVTSKAVLDKKLGTHITLLAWPFGIYNHYLEEKAAKAGYVMAFSIDYRCATKSDKPMAEPRYMIIQSQTMKTFEAMTQCKMQPRVHKGGLSHNTM